jgi:eukaryotic-like serine/threonine-protein kinase
MGFLMRIPVNIVIVCTILLGCRTGIEIQEPLEQSSDDSFQYAYGPGRSHVSNGKLTPPLSLSWTTSISGGVSESHPAVKGTVLFIPTLVNGVDIYDISNGEELGWINVPGTVLGSPAAKDSFIYVPVTGGTSSLLLIDVASGEVILDIQGEPVELPALLFADRIITSGIFGSISCYLLGDSTVQWSVKMPKPAFGAPSASGNTVFVSSSNGDLYAYDVKDGTKLWRLHTGAAIHASPVTNGTIVATINRNGECFVVDADTGNILWTKSLNIPVYSAPALEGELLVIAGTDGIIRAYNTVDGTERWTYSSGSLPADSPVISGLHIVVVNMNGKIVLLNKHSGNKVWETKVDGRIRTSAIVQGSMLCILSEEGKLYGFSATK